MWLRYSRISCIKRLTCKGLNFDRSNQRSLDWRMSSAWRRATGTNRAEFRNSEARVSSVATYPSSNATLRA